MNKRILLLILILCIAAFFRLYKLGDIPNGLQQDETSLGYNAYSILKTGKDEHGVLLPQNFQAFGEYKLPGYIYATVPSIALFGLTPFAIRFPSALFGTLTLVSIYALTNLLVKQFQAETKKQAFIYIPLIVTLLMALNPWHIFFSRAAFEVNLANFFLITGVYFLLSGLHQKKQSLLLLSIALGALSVYTYNIARAFTPLLYIALLVLYNNKVKVISKQTKIFTIIFGLVCLGPFLWGISQHGGANSTAGTLIVSSAKIQAQLLELRSYFVNLPPIFGKLIVNYWTLTTWYFFNNIAAHLSVPFYFIWGSEHGNNGIGTHGQWYLFELPLVLIGFVWLWQNHRAKMAQTMLLWIGLLITISAFTREAPQATRTFFLVYPVSLISSFGLSLIFSNIRQLQPLFVQKLVFTVLGLVFLGSVSFFILSYTLRFPIYYAKHWRTADRDVVTFLKPIIGNYQKIIFDTHSGFTYISLLMYLPVAPNEFQQATWTTPDSEGFTKPLAFGNYEFRPINWEVDAKLSNTLIITNQTDIPFPAKKLETIYYPKRPVVINKGQEIFQYPVAEVGYVLVETNKTPPIANN